LSKARKTPPQGVSQNGILQSSCAGRELGNSDKLRECGSSFIHLIFYTVDDDRIAVVRVIDGRMDVDEEFHR
jgi:hypothetical protein